MLAVVTAAVAAAVELLLGSLLLWQPHPGVVLLAALAVGLVRAPAQGMLVAFTGGVLLDLLAGPPLGRQALPLLLGTTLVFLRYSELARRTVLAPVAAAALGTALYWLSLGLVEALLGRVLPWGDLLVRWLLPSVVVNMLLIWPAVIAVTSLPLRPANRLPRRP